MSAQDLPSRPEGDKPEGLSKYLKRMKTVLRPRSSSKRQSVATLPNVGESSSRPTYAPTRIPYFYIKKPPYLEHQIQHITSLRKPNTTNS